MGHFQKLKIHTQNFKSYKTIIKFYIFRAMDFGFNPESGYIHYKSYF